MRRRERIQESSRCIPKDGEGSTFFYRAHGCKKRRIGRNLFFYFTTVKKCASMTAEIEYRCQPQPFIRHTETGENPYESVTVIPAGQVKSDTWRLAAFCRNRKCAHLLFRPCCIRSKAFLRSAVLAGRFFFPSCFDALPMGWQSRNKYILLSLVGLYEKR